MLCDCSGNEKPDVKMMKCFNEIRPQILWTGPSKPAHIRQEDSFVTEWLNTLRSLCPETDIERDYVKQRIYVGDELILMRTPGSAESTIRPPALQKILPDMTQVKIDAAKIKLKEEKQKRVNGE